MGIDWESYWDKENQGVKTIILDRVLEKCGFNSLLSRKALKIGEMLLIKEDKGKNKTIVEVGSGTGVLSLGLGNLISNSRVILIDIVLGVLKKVDFEQSLNIMAINANITAIPLKSDCCDLSCNLGTMEHFSEPVPIIKEMKRISRKYILCTVPALSVIWKTGTVIRKYIEKDCSLWAEHAFQYSESDLSDLFKAAGINNIHTVQQRFLGFPFINIVYGNK